jgi:hypothetical protein
MDGMDSRLFGSHPWPRNFFFSFSVYFFLHYLVKMRRCASLYAVRQKHRLIDSVDPFSQEADDEGLHASFAFSAALFFFLDLTRKQKSIIAVLRGNVFLLI